MAAQNKGDKRKEKASKGFHIESPVDEVPNLAHPMEVPELKMHQESGPFSQG